MTGGARLYVRRRAVIWQEERVYMEQLFSHRKVIHHFPKLSHRASFPVFYPPTCQQGRNAGKKKKWEQMSKLNQVGELFFVTKKGLPLHAIMF